MHLKIITHEKVVFDENVDEIYTKTTDGEMGILKNHVPVMEALILTTTAERGDEIDVARAKDALNRAKARLADSEAEIDAKRAEAAVARAMARLKAILNS